MHVQIYLSIKQFMYVCICMYCMHLSMYQHLNDAGMHVFNEIAGTRITSSFASPSQTKYMAMYVCMYVCWIIIRTVSTHIVK